MADIDINDIDDDNDQTVTLPQYPWVKAPVLASINDPVKFIDYCGLLCTLDTRTGEHLPVEFNGYHLAIVPPKGEGHDAEANTATATTPAAAVPAPVTREEFRNAVRALMNVRPHHYIFEAVEAVDLAENLPAKGAPRADPHKALTQDGSVMREMRDSYDTIYRYMMQERDRVKCWVPNFKDDKEEEEAAH